MHAEALHFPDSLLVPENKLHLELRTALYLILKLAFAKAHSVGCDQFVYWDPRNPKRCLAPDAFLKLDQPDQLFRSWKTWERGGPPEVAVEVISDVDDPWNEKLAKYQELGVRELVRFDPDQPAGKRFAVWNRVRGKLVPRTLKGETAPSKVLSGLRWVVAPILGVGVGPRLAREDGSLLPTERELAKAATATAATAKRKAAAAERELARLRAELAALKKKKT
ncbi:MAG: Uma2 family endonuclease [Labilithrix sp.]|nr:Uma2 family endonuclease [Labilithrix sp.]MCW5815709.1 Uma2 family endonuclease [Labilithrix sp.]